MKQERSKQGMEFGFSHLAAALVAFLALLYCFSLLPGSLANAQYALGDAAFAQCIAGSGEILHCGNFGYPGGSTKPFGLPVSLLAVLVAGVDGPVGLMDVRWAHVIILVFAFIGAGIFFARLASNAWLGITGALLYLVSPAVLLQSSYGALQLGMALLPAYLLVDASLLEAVRRGGLYRFVPVFLMVAAVRTWAIYLDGYSFLFSGLLAGSWFVASGVGRRDWRRLAMVLIAYAAASAVAALAYRTYISGDALGGMSLAFYRAAGVDVVTLLLPPVSHPVYGLLGIGHPVTSAMTWSDGSNLIGTFLGYATIPSAAVVAILAWRSRSAPPVGLLALLAAGSVALLLSLGPSLKVADYRPADSTSAQYVMPEAAATAALPTAPAYRLPGIGNARVLARWLVVTRLALVALTVFAAACLFRRRRHFLAAGLLLFAAVEAMPDPAQLQDKGRRVYAHAHWIHNDLSADFARGTREKEQVYLLQLHDRPGGNEYVANTLCARAGVHCYNAGGDKASILIRRFWPAQILGTKKGDDVAGNLRSALDQGLVDVVVVPYFDLRAVVYGLRQAEVRVDRVRERTQALAKALGAEVAHGAHFSFIRRGQALLPARTQGLADAGDPEPPERYRMRMPAVDALLAVLPADPDRPLSTVPGRLDGCAPGGRFVVTVWWNASSHGARKVELRVADRAAVETKLWTTGGTSGRRDTGPWMQEGSVIQLHDAEDGRMLERLVLESSACEARNTDGSDSGLQALRQ